MRDIINQPWRSRPPILPIRLVYQIGRVPGLPSDRRDDHGGCPEAAVASPNQIA